MKKTYRLTIGATICAAIFALSPAFEQSANAQRGRDRNRDRDKELEAEPLVGLTTNGEVIPDLFSIAPSGVSTEPVIAAAKAFLAGLDEAQRAKTTFAVDDLEWRKWNNVHFYVRAGVGFDEMTETQRELAFDLFRVSLSARGMKQTRDIMRLNGTLGELKDNYDEYNEWLYWVTIMGEPSATEPWGWQIDGHHVIINYFVLGDQVVMTPTFMGSEPIRAKSGKFEGAEVMQDEEARGLAMINALDESQQAKAIITSEKTGNNSLAQAFKDNVVVDYAGILGAELNDKQKANLLELIEAHVGHMDDGHARVRMDEVREHLDQTYFAWIGGTGKDSVFYYRVHGPVIYIEFDHQRPVGLGGPRVPTRNHVHSVIRTPNGNDYGKDLLRQHYAKHHHE